MTQRNHSTHIEDPGDVSCHIEGYTIELGTLLWGPAMNLPPHMARWLAKELMMQAADIDRKQARSLCDKAAEVMKR